MAPDQKSTKLGRAAHVVALAVLTAAISLMCWNATSNFVSNLFGDDGDPVQTLWNGWWTGYALSHGESPLFTRMMFHPDGISMWLQTYGPLNAALTAVGQAVLPGFVGHNLVVLGQLVLAAYATFVLTAHVLLRARERGALPRTLRRSTIAACSIAAGATFGLSPYVWAHVNGQLHCISTGPLVFFAYALLRASETRGWRWPLLAAGCAFAAGLCGWYVVFDAALLGVGFAFVALPVALVDRGKALRRLALAGVLSGAALAPLVVPTIRAQQQALDGVHDPDVFCADLAALYTPAPMMGAQTPADAQAFGRWSGRFENGGYLGVIASALALLGLLAVRGRALGSVGVAGLVGMVLSFGPHPHVEGVIHADVDLPYAWLQRVAPAIDGLGCPVRFQVLMTLALAVGAGAGLAALMSLLTRARPRRLLAAVLPIVVAAGIVYEYRPLGVASTSLPSFAMLDALAERPEPFAVADFTGWSPPLYHQTRHAHPIVGGYASRRPLALVEKLQRDPVLGLLTQDSLGTPMGWNSVPGLDRVDPNIDFDWGDGGPAHGIAHDFSARWTGSLHVETTGLYGFTLGSDDGATLDLDGQRVVDNGGNHPYTESRGQAFLEAGEHDVVLAFYDEGGKATVRWRWQPPGGAEVPVPTSALRAPGGAPGLLGRYTQRAILFNLVGEPARKHLRDVWGVRFVIAPSGRYLYELHTELGLTLRGEENGVRLYEVRLDGEAPLELR